MESRSQREGQGSRTCIAIRLLSCTFKIRICKRFWRPNNLQSVISAPLHSISRGVPVSRVSGLPTIVLGLLAPACFGSSFKHLHTAVATPAKCIACGGNHPAFHAECPFKMKAKADAKAHFDLRRRFRPTEAMDTSKE